MSPGQEQEVPAASAAFDIWPDSAAEVTSNSHAVPDAEVGAVPYTAAEPEIAYDSTTATTAVSRLEAGALALTLSRTPPSVAPATESNEVVSVSVDGQPAPTEATAVDTVPSNTAEVAPDAAGTAAAPGNARVAEVAPIRAEPEHDDEVVGNNAAVTVHSDRADVAVASNAAAGVQINAVEMVADIADVLPNGGVQAVAAGVEGGQGGAPPGDDDEDEERKDEDGVDGHVVAEGAFGGDTVLEQVLGGDTAPPTSAGNAGAGAAEATSTSWLGWLSRAKRAIVAATLPSGDSTMTGYETQGASSSPDDKRRLGAGWRPYPGAAFYRRDVKVVEDFGMLGKDNRRGLYYS